METKGKKLLKVCGVLFTIEGIVGVIVYGIMALMLEMGSIVEKSADGEIVAGIAVAYLIASVVSLITGVLGIKRADDKKAAGKCLAWGVLNLALTFASGVWSAIGESSTPVQFIYTAAGLIIPSLYIAGAYMNKE